MKLHEELKTHELISSLVFTPVLSGIPGVFVLTSEMTQKGQVI